MRIQIEDTLMVAVDFQEKLLPAIYDQEEILRKSEFLIRGLKELGVECFMTTQYAKGLGYNVSSIVELIGEDNNFDKISFGIYMDEQIKKKIDESGKKYIIIAGTEAHICVLQSVIDLAAAGYVPVLITDCIGSRHPGDKEAALLRANQEGAILTSAESLLYELMASAKHPHFKEISKLVKEQG